MISDGKSVVIDNIKLKTMDLYPLSKTPLKLLLDDKIDLSGNKVKSVKEEDDLTTIQLVDKSVFGNATITMMFDPKSYDLRQWTITDAQGKDTTVMIFNVKQGVKLDQKLFKINYGPAAGVQPARRQQSLTSAAAPAVRWGSTRLRGLVSRGLSWQFPELPDPPGNLPMPLSIATWNINSVRLRLPIVERLLREHAPDVFCLQETKCPDELFPLAAFEALGYEHIAIHGQKGYHGVATIARRPIEIVERRRFCDIPDSRHLSARVAAGGDQRAAPQFLRAGRRRRARSARSIRNSATSSISSTR